MPRMKSRILILLIGFLTGTAWASAGEAAGLQDSVLRIVNYSQRGDWYSPWNLSPVRQSSGSGFIIRGGLVMTNAHVVSDSRHLVIFLHNDPVPHPARVHLIGHDCDLALLTPVEAGLLEGHPALKFGGLPQLGTSVVTLGYPAGGSGISSTEGIVSRIEPQLYVHSGVDQHLTYQTDAAINPGNSGGPVIQDGHVVGVAFQAAQNLQSVGYFIPMEVISRFLGDVKDGRYDGYPELGLRTSSLENPAARRRALMQNDETGVQVNSIYPGSSADERLRAKDILLQVDGHPVANDGTVADGVQRMGFGMLVDRHQIGDKVKLRILRAGEHLDLEVPLANLPWARRNSNLYDILPRYYIYGGLVFVPLDLELLKTFGDNWPETGDKAMLYEALVRPFQDRDLLTHERVVLLRRLKHPVNSGMAWFRNQVIERVNGRQIKSLEDLIQALETNREDYQFFEFASYRRIGVLDRRAAQRANAEILKRYGVPRDRRP